MNERKSETQSKVLAAQSKVLAARMAKWQKEVTEAENSKGSGEILYEANVAMLLNALVRQCHSCGGSGRHHNIEWKSWWMQHQGDWREQISAGKGPAEAEYLTCAVCKGRCVELTPEGIMLIKFLKTYWDRVPITERTDA